MMLVKIGDAWVNPDLVAFVTQGRVGWSRMVTSDGTWAEVALTPDEVVEIIKQATTRRVEGICRRTECEEHGCG